MTSGMRQILHEAALWIAVFVAALGAFMYLDEHIGAFLTRSPAADAPSSPSSTPRLADAPVPHVLEPATAAEATADDDEESSPGRVILRAGASGHFAVKAYINNRPVDLMADTGATYVVLSWDDARSLGLTGNLDFSGTAHTANGTSKVAPVMLDKVEVGDIRLDGVKAIVTERGALDTSLLGMSFIGRLKSFQMSGRKLVLVN